MFFANNIGVLIGPTLGGLVYAKAGYYAVIWMMSGLVAGDLILRLVMVEKKLAVKASDNEALAGSRPRPPRASWDEDNGSHRTKQSTTTTNTVEENTPLLPKPIKSRRKKNKVPPLLRLLGSLRVLANCYAVLIGYAVLSAFDAGLPLFVKQTFGWDAKGAGLIFLTIALPSLLSPVAGRLSSKFGPRWIVLSGLLLVGVCSILLRLINKDQPQHMVGLCLLMIGIGMKSDGDTHELAC